MKLASMLAILGAAGMAGGLVIVFVAALLDRSQRDGPVVFALVWAGALTCSVGTLVLVGALGVAAGDALLP